MSRLRVSVPHSLGSAEALARMQSFAQRLRAEHAAHISNVVEEWEGNTGRFRLTLMGMALQATAQVGEAEVTLEGPLPFAAMFFRGRIEEIIRREIAAVLS